MNHAIALLLSTLALPIPALPALAGPATEAPAMEALAMEAPAMQVPARTGGVKAAGTKSDYVATRDAASARPPAGDPAHAGRDPTRRFVESNITETLYHELAHAMIDVMDLPVFGPEEFAADLFSIVLINRLHDEDAVVAMTYDVAAAYDAGALKENAAGNGPAMWGVHGADRQRYFNLACLMYGANTGERDDVARELGLPDERAETCEAEYAMTARAWGQVLDRLAQDAPGTSLTMDWILDEDSHLTRFVRGEVDRLNAVMVLPETISVSVIPCGQANAFYDPGPREILICTEMGEHFAALAP